MGRLLYRPVDVEENVDHGLVVGHGEAEVARVAHLVQVRVLRTRHTKLDYYQSRPQEREHLYNLPHPSLTYSHTVTPSASTCLLDFFIINLEFQVLRSKSTVI